MAVLGVGWVKHDFWTSEFFPHDIVLLYLIQIILKSQMNGNII